MKNPFVGLRPFQAPDASVFFGREHVVGRVVQKLADARLLAVIGPSGSGKSSIVRAGVLPALDAGFLPQAGTVWSQVVLRPAGDPLGGLAHGLADAGLMRDGERDDATRLAMIQTLLDRGSMGLCEVVRQSRLPADHAVLVVVDQFEELFRYGASVHDRDRAAAFVKLLLEVLDHPQRRIWVLLTMRTDFLGDCVRFRGLAEAVSDNQVLIPRLTRANRRLAITGPLAVAGAQATPRLVTTLLNDVDDESDQLPMLQHALRRTFACWQSQGGTGPLTLDHYTRIGTVRGALDAHAEESLTRLSPEQRDLAARAFATITTMEGGRGVRRPLPLATLAHVLDTDTATLRPVLQEFAGPEEGFLMPLGSDLALVDISHESLMRVWSRLRGWTAEEARRAELFAQLLTRSALHAQGRAGLYAGPELALALEWRDTEAPTPGWLALAGGDASVGAMRFLADSEAEQARIAARRAAAAQRKRRLLLGFVALLLIVLTGVLALLGVALNQRDRAILAEGEAYAREAEAVRLRQEASALLDDKVAALADKEAAFEEAERRRKEALAATEEANANLLVAQTAKRSADRSRDEANLERARAQQSETRRARNQLFIAAQQLHHTQQDPSGAVPFLADLPTDGMPRGALPLAWEVLNAPRAHVEWTNVLPDGSTVRWARVSEHGVLLVTDDSVWIQPGPDTALQLDTKVPVQAALSEAGVALGYADGSVRTASWQGTLSKRADRHAAPVTALGWQGEWVSGASDGTVWRSGRAVQLNGGPVFQIVPGAPLRVVLRDGVAAWGDAPATVPSGIPTAATSTGLVATSTAYLGDRQLPAQVGTIVEVEALPSKGAVFYDSDGTGGIWTGRASAPELFEEITDVAMSPDGRLAATAAGDHAQLIFLDLGGEVLDIQHLTGFDADLGAIVAVGFDNSMLRTVSSNGTVREWRTDLLTPWIPFGAVQPEGWNAQNQLIVQGVAYDPALQRPALASTPLQVEPDPSVVNGAVPLSWTRADGAGSVQEDLILRNPSDPIVWTRLSPNGRWLATTSVSGRTRVWWLPDVETCQTLLQSAAGLCHDGYRTRYLGPGAPPFENTCL